MRYAYVPRRVVIANRRAGGAWHLLWKLPLVLLLWSLWALPLGAGVAAVVVVRGYVADLPQVPDLDAWMDALPQTSRIRAADGTLLAEIPFRDGELVGHRRAVRFAELPKTLIDALLAAEDARFFAHRGVDVRAVVRAARANYVAGRVVEGASTITQQVARNLLPEGIGSARKLRRKVREAVLAWRIERSFSKARILEVYANEIFLGAGAYGVAAAARAYFDRPLSALALHELALIAGLAQAPGRADPYKNRAAARARRDQVLARMAGAGFIAEAEAAAAAALPIVLTPPRERYGSLAPWYTERVRQEVAEAMPAAYARGGLDIDTAALPLLSAGAEDAGRDWAGRLARANRQGGRGAEAGEQGETQPQLGAVIWDHRTGYLEATIGGRDFAESRFDRATQACRQPGSAFKPVVYAAALERGVITPGTPLRDAPIAVYDDELEVYWKPRSAKSFRGAVLAQDALAASLNPPAVDVLDRVGFAPVIDLAERLGITTRLVEVRPLALGASCVVPLELAGAFAAFARGGRRAQPVFAVRVRRGGEVLIERASPLDAGLDAGRRLDRLFASLDDAGARVLDRQTAFQMRDMLADVVRRGTGRDARRLGRPLAGKTGTTNDNTDAWFVGFSGRVVVAVWIGYDDPQKSLGPRQDGGHAALPLWMDLVRLAEKQRPERPVPGPAPAGMELVRVDQESGRLARPGSGGASAVWFKPGQAPTLEAGAVGELPMDLGRLSREF